MGTMGKQRWAMSAAGDARSSGRRAADRSAGLSGGLVGRVFAPVFIAIFSGGLLGLVSIYGSGLRDPRYLDGWVLAGGMILQLSFHVAIKMCWLSPKTAVRAKKLHMFLGYLLIAAFISHCDFSLPDSGFEWALWAGFVAVTLSGIFGAYLAWSLKAKREIDERIGYDRIAARRAELAQDVRAVVAETDPAAVELGLPVPPYDAWITDLYARHLSDFFQGPRNFSAHLIRSQRPLKHLTDEIDNLSRYVDRPAQDKLAAIKELVIAKDRLDFAHVYHGLTKFWMFVHVPVTYALIVLTVLHVVVVYAFSSGNW